MSSSKFGFYPQPKHIIWPWKATFHYYNMSRPEDQVIILHNTNASCDDAGEYTCRTILLKGTLITHNKTQLLRKKASCYKITTETSPLPAGTAYSGVNVTDSNPYSEPSTQSSGIQVVTGSGKSSFIAEAIVLIVIVKFVM
ncbi:unnamed protein product [Lymnaea stagnalis]|uniref:Ig-like domain-containing protein n=1 Tax=Lymnaea stagnalis TaxID=6523 RepID=A0AAV2HXG2_LYMST